LVLEGEKVIQVGRLSGIEKFENERETFTYSMIIYFKPVKIFEEWCE